jgi:hypothetical protein
MENQKEQDAVLGIVLLLIALLCLGFSFVTMTLGYKDLVGSIWGSGVLSLILVLMLFALNYRLRRGLQSGMSPKQMSGVIILYIVVVFASFSGLFNRFYSTFMQDELIKEELQQKISSMQDIQSRAKAELTNLEAEKIRGGIESKITQLSQQIQNTGQPGLGSKARMILDDIERDLNTKLTVLVWQDNTTAGLQKLSDNYATMIRNVMEQSAGMRRINEPERRAYVTQMLSESSKSIADMTGSMKASVNKTEVARADGLAVLQEAVNTYKGIGAKVRSLLKDKNFQYDADIRVNNDEIGKISHTFRSAWQHIGHWAVWISAFLALMIDLIVPLFVYVLTPRGHQSTPLRKTERKDIQVL